MGDWDLDKKIDKNGNLSTLHNYDKKRWGLNEW